MQALTCDPASWSLSFSRTIPYISQTQLSTAKLRDHNMNKSFITLKKICSWDINAQFRLHLSKPHKVIRGEWITLALQLSPGTFGIPQPFGKDRAQNVCQYPIIDWIKTESLFNAKALLCWSSCWATDGRQCRHGWQCQTNTKEKLCWQHRFLFTLIYEEVSISFLLCGMCDDPGKSTS